MHLIAQEKSDQWVSAILDISPLTVSAHFQQIRRKLNVETRDQAKAVWLRRNPGLRED